MEAKNIRIGNLVARKPHKLYIPFAVKDGEVTEFFARKCKPIQLTENLICRFGFRKDGDNYYELKLNNGFYLGAYGFGLNNSKYEVFLTDSENNELTRIENAHELQNLFFALTGTELELKNDG
jgi:hypothetical protein